MRFFSFQKNRMTRYSYNTLSYTLLHTPYAKRGTDFVSIVLVLQFFPSLSVFVFTRFIRSNHD